MGQRLTRGPRPRTPAAQGSAWQVPGRCGGTQAAGGARRRGAEQPLGRPEGVVNSRPHSPEAAACGHRASSVPRGGRAARARRSLTPSSPAGHSAHGTGSAHQPGAAEAAGQLAPSPGSARGLEEPPPLTSGDHEGRTTTRSCHLRHAVLGHDSGSAGRAVEAAGSAGHAACSPRPCPDGPDAREGSRSGPEARGLVCVCVPCHLSGRLSPWGGRAGGRPTLPLPRKPASRPSRGVPGARAPPASGTFLGFSALGTRTACRSRVQPSSAGGDTRHSPRSLPLPDLVRTTFKGFLRSFAQQPTPHTHAHVLTHTCAHTRTHSRVH